MEKVIEIRGLTKRFKDLIAVDNLDLNVFRGNVFGFLGPNGAGKSTTIRMMLSLIYPTRGDITIFGKSLQEDRINILSKIGAIVEKPDFYLYLTAYKNLEILGRISGADISRSNIMRVLELVGLDQRWNSKVKTYSHGMKQRLGLAQALLHDPELIILDEPTTGLDPQGIKDIRDLIVTLSKEKGKTIFLSSHILKEVELVADRMIILNKGRKQIEGSVAELLNIEKLSVTFEFENMDEANRSLDESKWKEYLKNRSNSEMTFELEKEEIHLLNKFFVERNVGINAVVPKRSLEEFFLRILKESNQ